MAIHATAPICRHQHHDDLEAAAFNSSLFQFLKPFLPISHANIRYNFVIFRDRLIFVRLPPQQQTVSYLLTKHMTLANKSTDVRFAGEMWWDEFGRWRINKSSGTYRPSDKMLEHVIQLLQELNLASNIRKGSRSPMSVRQLMKRSFHFWPSLLFKIWSVSKRVWYEISWSLGSVCIWAYYIFDIHQPVINID